MKRKILLLIVISLGLLTCACSYSIEYAIVNNSDSEIKVEYVLKGNLAALTDSTVRPKKMDISKYNSWFSSKEWSEVADKDFNYDPNTKKCKLKLLPNEVLRLTYIIDNQMQNGEIKDFPIESVRLNGTSGELIYQGNEFYKQFKEQNMQNYFISYK